MKLSSTYTGFRRLGMRSSLRFFAFTAALFVFAALQAFAQEATVVGTVTDQTGAALPNITITLTNAETGLVKTITSNDAGEFVLPGLKVGHYTAKAEGSGFTVSEKTGLVLALGDRLRVDFSMKVGAATEHVTVEGNAVAVQADSGEVSSVITGQQVTQLATNGRSMYTLEGLTPGASSAQTDFQVPTSAGGDNNVSFNGLRVSHNLWLIDGGEAADRGGGGGSDVMPSIDAIGEFRMLTSNYSAEYGLSSAGTLTMVIKSGTRKLHASAWYFGRNDAFNARNYFNPAPAKVSELRFHIYGFNVGGPVSFHPNKSNPKTFFFFNMEWRKLIQGGGTRTLNVPQTAWYPGANGAAFTGGPTVSDPCDGVSCNTGKIVDPVIQFRNCPGGTAPAGVVPGSAFPNNTIPTCMLDPNAVALAAQGIFPKANAGIANFSGGANAPTNGKEEIVRIDHQFTDKFSVFGHWIQDQSLQTFATPMWSGINTPSVGNTFGNPGYHYTIHATALIRPNLLNEVAFNSNGNRIHILPIGVWQQPTGFTNSTVFGGNTAKINPQVNLNKLGLNYGTGSFPWNNSADDYQIRDDVSWTHGAHQFKFGGSWSIYKKVQNWFAQPQGTFTFDGTYTGLGNGASGLDFADFLLGYNSGYAENAIKQYGYWNAVSPAAYLQDNWRVNHRLTLNLGLRWDGMPHTYEAKNNMSNFLPSLYNPANAPLWANGNDSQICGPSTPTPNNCGGQVSPGLGPSTESALSGLLFYLNGVGRAGSNGVPKNMTRNTWNAFGPRVGLAYDVTGSGKTIVRAGFGIMYERIQGNDMYNAANNPPWNFSLGGGGNLFSDPAQFLNDHTLTINPAESVPVNGITGISQHYKVPTSYQYSAGVQQQLGANTVFSISYVGNQNRQQSYQENINLAPENELVNLYKTGTGNGCLAPLNCSAGFAVTSNNTPQNGALLYPGLGSIVMATTGANSHYNSLQAEIHGKVYRDLNLQAAYTLARAIDPSQGGSGMDLANVSNPYAGWQFDVGPSQLDRTHALFVNFVYDIPLLKNSSNKVLKGTVGGWQLSGIVTVMSGLPLNVTYGGSNACAVISNCAMRPDKVGAISYPKSATTFPGSFQPTVQWFSPSAFGAPSAPTNANPTAPLSFGNLPFNALRGPGRSNTNLSLFKNFTINEERGTRFEFRVETFNTWNHTEWGGSGTNAGVATGTSDPKFGKVTNTWDARTLQFGGKLVF